MQADTESGVPSESEVAPCLFLKSIPSTGYPLAWAWNMLGIW
jgi:hypothetical protein